MPAIPFEKIRHQESEEEGSSGSCAGCGEMWPCTGWISEVKTVNDYILGFGENLPNHSESMGGRGKYVRQMRAEIPTFRDRQTAYRFCAYVLSMADVLPDEEGQEGITFNDVLSAIQNA